MLATVEPKRQLARFRGRSYVAFVFSPTVPIVEWLEEIDATLERSPGFFVGRPVVLDLTAVDLGDIELQPVYDPASHLVYAAGREHVSDVWVAGNHVVNAQQMPGLDLPSLDSHARVWQNRVRD